MNLIKFVFVSIGQLVWVALLWCFVVIASICGIPMLLLCMFLGLRNEYLDLQKKLGDSGKAYIVDLSKRKI